MSTSQTFRSPDEPRRNTNTDPVFLLFTTIADAVQELHGREDEEDYWLSPDEVLQRRETLHALEHALAGAAEVTITADEER